jgi:hypothetical protein
MPVPKGAGREKASTASAGVTCHPAGMVVEGRWQNTDFSRAERRPVP